ncbi:restriction endonuclease subunit S [Vibrio diabolicus]|uniref:restriction endonuclease subunit S n=1 Tax=Vibrio diabolicus TaxID=50719 RepID=UPI003751C2BA
MSNLSAMPKYAEYKEAVGSCVDKLPIHWEIKRFRDLFVLGKGLTITKENLQEDGIPCVSYGEVHSKFGFRVNPNEHALMCVSEDYLKSSKSSLLKRGDFVFADTSEDIDGSGNFTYLDSDKETFAGYHTIIARPLPKLNYQYLAFLMDSMAFREQIRRKVKGVKVFSITKSILKGLQMWLPSDAEQQEIVSFLSPRKAKIEEAIEVKEQQIALLKERKQIIIQQAVTQGLNPCASMKDSGVEWIGKIPEHWKVRRLKYVLEERNERSVKGDEPLLMVSQTHGLVVRADYHKKAEVAASNVDNKLVHHNDLVFNKLKAHLGVFFKSTIPFVGSVSPDYAVYKSKSFIKDMKLLELLFRHPAYIEQFVIRSTGVVEGLIRLYTSELFDIPVPIAPEDEQKEILEYIANQSEKIDEVIALQVKQIDKLKEYKTTLINAAVTGKIKVA